MEPSGFAYSVVSLSFLARSEAADSIRACEENNLRASMKLIHKGFRRLTLAADPLVWFASLTRRFTPAVEPAASL